MTVHCLDLATHAQAKSGITHFLPLLLVVMELILHHTFIKGLDFSQTLLFKLWQSTDCITCII